MIHHQQNQNLSKKMKKQLNKIQVVKEIMKYQIQYLLHLGIYKEKDYRNKDGYKMTIKYANKFDIISPAWFTIRFNNIIDGKQDVNEQWVQQVKQQNPKIQIIPRIFIELEQQTIIEQINKPQLMEAILNIIQQYQYFDGIMIDTPYLSFIDTLQVYDLLEFLQKLKNKLNSNTKKIKLLLTLYGNYGNQQYKHSTIKKLFKIADYTLIQTYDYQIQEEEQQLLAPYEWIQQNLEYFMIYKEKLLLGIPFYGFIKTDDTLNHIIGNKFLTLNPEDYVSEWDSSVSECIYSNEDQIISYPCPQFIKNRLDLIKEFDRGYFIWEGGQGLELFYQML